MEHKTYSMFLVSLTDWTASPCPPNSQKYLNFKNYIWMFDGCRWRHDIIMASEKWAWWESLSLEACYQKLFHMRRLVIWAEFGPVSILFPGSWRDCCTPTLPWSDTSGCQTNGVVWFWTMNFQTISGNKTFSFQRHPLGV